MSRYSNVGTYKDRTGQARPGTEGWVCGVKAPALLRVRRRVVFGDVQLSAALCNARASGCPSAFLPWGPLVLVCTAELVF